nr:zinc finger, SWIM-type [Tanacetum cinerariifolium]
MRSLEYGDIIPHVLRRNTNIYGEKNETVEKLTDEAAFVLEECLFLLIKDGDKLAKTSNDNCSCYQTSSKNYCC